MGPGNVSDTAVMWTGDSTSKPGTFRQSLVYEKLACTELQLIFLLLLHLIKALMPP